MKVSVIIATSSNLVIGLNNQLPWHLPADLKYFKSITTGHHMVMGRKTFDSIGKPLPGRVSVIVTRNKDYKREDCKVVHSVEEAVALAQISGETELFIIGGAEIIIGSLKLVDKIYLTEIKQEFKGDVFLPPLDRTIWKETSREDHKADEKNLYDYSFLQLERSS